MERGSDDKTVIDDGMTVKLQYERGQVHLKMLTRSDIHLCMIASSLEDGLAGNNTLFLRVVLTRYRWPYRRYSQMESVPIFICGCRRITLA